MSQPSSGPPNPRQARYRQIPVRWSNTSVSLFLIVVSCLVAAVSKLGSDPAPVAGFYFSIPIPKSEVVEITQRLDEMDENGGEDSLEYQELIAEYERLVAPRSRPLQLITQGQIWRLVTPMFLHFGAIHLIFNMMWMWTLARPLEALLRPTRFLLLVLGISAISNVAQALMSGSTNFGGMSGVVYGLFGFVIVQGRLNPMGSLQLDARTVRYMLIWLVLCFTGYLGPVANWAHTFGLVTGGTIGAIAGLRAGGWKSIRRRHDFRRAIQEISGTLHSCAVCGKTENDDPDLEFRVAPDGQEYCEVHNPTPETSPNAR